MKGTPGICKIYEKCLWFITILAMLAAAVVTVPKLAGIWPYMILSSSMEPTIPTGSLVFVNTKDKQAANGDIVTFSMTNGKDEITVTHRIVETTAEGFITKGDNNEVNDLKPLTADRIVGTYAASVPYAGYIMSKITKKGLVVAIGWLFGAHLFGFVLESITEDSETKDSSPKHIKDQKQTNQISPKSNMDSK
ncbi:MAG: signal peptidase I [Lachnospiraceae bacterium]|nr:signal peptidase I [Lachnospiraceae bacterium]